MSYEWISAVPLFSLLQKHVLCVCDPFPTQTWRTNRFARLQQTGIAQFTLSQHSADFLEEGQMILSNVGTCFFLGMQRHAAQKLKLAEELERVLEEGVSGRAVMRCEREYAAIDVAKGSPLHRALFTTDLGERRLLRQQRQKRQQDGVSKEHQSKTEVSVPTFPTEEPPSPGEGQDSCLEASPVLRHLLCKKSSSTRSPGNLSPLRKQAAKKRKVADKLILHRR